MNEIVEAEFALGDAKITVRGPQPFVQAELARLATLLRSGSSSERPDTPQEPKSEDSDGLAGQRDERSFVALKSPKGHPETATVLGFWLCAHGASEFTEEDVRRAYIRAGVRPPKVVAQALRDAKRSLDSIEQGSKRGVYKLTAHGDRLVRFDMPRQRR